MSMTKGDGGTFGLLYYPSTVGNGTEVWARGYYYFASPWSWANASGGYRAIKLLRGIGTSNGFLSVFSDTNGVIQLSNEPGDEQTYTSPDSPGAPLYEKDKWQCIEMYVKLSATQGAFRIWKNGVLVQEDMNTKTLRNASDSATNAYFMSNWNDTVVQAQTMYMDDVVVTTDRPTKVDAKGNPMIGPISGPITTPVKPKAPTSLQVR
ncbi:MAG TPA: hypothetical protein DCS07_17875 [Bdellovibrionales bacterium]|nr:MAG: hypothetical protein A2Z97_05400 [Bdellovibrionales bacterium GWB1_52_6]OFZ05706.1 MAG: hypothetical protein A2X97_03305 [Bdellovibrionales bacterium GWA1_52_35]OFZ40655.1 MAG: hypothetical protein A2070_06310 [Bdellovibrionales bacterium GWC1_52_8]HAR44471.1 hypothetical protein [Bdellovibrionales bacterium]HCM40357.1 hypothetical protein [Bdellovibrionales bacterium]